MQNLKLTVLVSPLRKRWNYLYLSLREVDLRIDELLLRYPDLTEKKNPSEEEG